MRASHNLGRRRGRALSCSSPQLKVRPKDNRLSRRAFRLLALTSCQQLRKDSLIGVRNRANNRKAGNWDERRRHHGLLTTCPMTRLLN